MITETAVNRQIGDYVVVLVDHKTTVRGPYAVRMAGAEEHLSFHPDVTDAVHAILRYQRRDERARARA